MAEGNEVSEQDKTYAQAKKEAGSTAAQIDARYVAEYYHTLIAMNTPDKLAEDLTKNFASELVNPKVIEKANQEVDG